MIADVAQSRVVAATAATLTLTGRDSEGEPADPGTVTVQVVDSSGSDVIASGTATSGSGNTRTIALTAAQTADVDLLTATWTVSGTVIQTTQHEIVGGVYCTVADMREGTALKNATTHTAADLKADRFEMETRVESVCWRSFVPRFYEEVLSGNGRPTLLLGWPNLRSVVTAEYWNGTAWAAMSATVADIPASDAGIATLRGGYTWPCGVNNIRVRYRHGLNQPPADLKRAVVKAIAYYRTQEKSGIPDRAISIQGSEIGNITLSTPGMRGAVTGIPMIDEVLNRPGYRFNRPLVA